MADIQESSKETAIKVIIAAMAVGLLIFCAVAMFVPSHAQTSGDPDAIRLMIVLTVVEAALAVIAIILMMVFADVVIPTMARYHRDLTDSLWFQQRMVPLAISEVIGLFGIVIVLLGRQNFSAVPGWVYLNLCYLVLFAVVAFKAWPRREQPEADTFGGEFVKRERPL